MSKRIQPTDQDEETRARGLAEQCWLGPLCLLFWVVIILACIHGCIQGAECKLAWDPNPSTDQVTKYLVKVEDFTGEFSITAETPATAVTIPFVPRGMPLIITLVAVNTKGPSGPAVIIHTYPYRIRVTNQRSDDLQTWRDHTFEEFDAPNREFFRQRIEYIP